MKEKGWKWNILHAYYRYIPKIESHSNYIIMKSVGYDNKLRKLFKKTVMYRDKHALFQIDWKIPCQPSSVAHRLGFVGDKCTHFPTTHYFPNK